MLRKNSDLPVLRDLKTAVMLSLMFRFLAGTVPGKAKLLKNMGIIDGLSLQALTSSPFRLTPRNSPFRGFLLSISGLCKIEKVQMDALDCTKWHESLPEPCRGFCRLGVCQDRWDSSAAECPIRWRRSHKGAGI